MAGDYREHPSACAFGAGCFRRASLRGDPSDRRRFSSFQAYCGNVRYSSFAGGWYERRAGSGQCGLLIDRIRRISGIKLEIINGEEEARLIHLAVVHELKLKKKRTLLIDIGGGSVEVTISTGQNIISTDSYNMGTVRLLERLDSKSKAKYPFGKLVREYAELALL